MVKDAALSWEHGPKTLGGLQWCRGESQKIPASTSSSAGLTAPPIHYDLRRRAGEELVTYPDDAIRQVLEKTLSGVPTVLAERKTLANGFYEQGDFLGALAVYQALARASMDPTWRWPAIYQIGLCFERMNMPQRAAEAYDAILAPGTAVDPGTRLPESLVSLQDMARWRRSHLVWIEDKARQLESLAGDASGS